jgi:hypothetical protein
MNPQITQISQISQQQKNYLPSIGRACSYPIYVIGGICG